MCSLGNGPLPHGQELLLGGLDVEVRTSGQRKSCGHICQSSERGTSRSARHLVLTLLNYLASLIRTYSVDRSRQLSSLVILEILMTPLIGSGRSLDKVVVRSLLCHLAWTFLCIGPRPFVCDTNIWLYTIYRTATCMLGFCLTPYCIVRTTNPSGRILTSLSARRHPYSVSVLHCDARLGSLPVSNPDIVDCNRQGAAEGEGTTHRNGAERTMP